MKLIRFSFFITLLCLLSCNTRLDFTQAEDFSTTPIFTTSLANFILLESDFIVPSTLTELSFRDDISDFTVLQNEFVRKNLIKIELLFNIKNEFNRSFIVDVEFLDNNNNTVHQFSTAQILANSQEDYTEIIPISRNRGLLTATKFKLTMRILNGPPLDINSNNEFVFKSSGTYFLRT